ncbi:MAG: phosphoribosyltransferase family protein, partial [Nevskiales bacterium]
FELDVLQASRYHNATQGSELLWKVMPSINLNGRVVLVIDDILDHGHTLKAVEEALLAQTPEALLVAVLVEKNTPQRIADVKVDFVGLQVPDAYVFGAGMDYKGYWRQLPGIYAVAGTGA